MERKLSLNSLFTLPLKSLLLLSSHTIRFWQLTRLWNILIVHSWLITKPFTIFAKRIWVLNAPATEIWIGWLVKLFLQSPLRYASTELSMSIWMNSKLTWFHTQEFISLLPPTLLSSPPIEPSTSNWAWAKSPLPVSNHPIKWSNAIQDMANIWHAVSSTVAMLCQRMSMLPLHKSRPREPFNSSIGVQLVSR